MLFSAKLLAVTQMLYLRICSSFSNTEYVHSHINLKELRLAACHVITEFFTAKVWNTIYCMAEALILSILCIFEEIMFTKGFLKI